MPKRKLSELSSAGRPTDSKAQKLSMKAVRLSNKFEQGVQIISRGLKVARGFERQKLSRREKTAKSQENSLATLGRLHEEIEALKGLDYHITAERYLFKQLLKIKRIAESNAFKEFQQSKNVSTEGPKSTAESNILARLYKSSPVQNVMPNILGDIRKLLGIGDTPAGKQVKAGGRKDALSEEKAKRRQAEKTESEYESASEGNAVQHSHLRDDEGVSADDDSGNEDFSPFDKRLAPGSDSEEDSDEDASRPDENEINDDISDSVSRSPSPDFSSTDSPPLKKAKGSKASAKAVTDTTFLPSLMMGGYWSGSEEATDDEEVAGPPKRKNRMGQQARRALWEKKYGAKANHVQKEQKKQKHSRDSDWDPRRGAVSTDVQGGKDYRGGRGRVGAGAGRPRKDQDGQAGPSPKGPPKDAGPLHPSWEAKRRLKEQASTAAFQGKKVVFD